jgi:long-chain fatty acid transport protein
LRGGVAFDETPVPAETRTARLPDAERTWVTIGARWSPSEAWTIDAGYAHLFSDDVSLDQDEGSVAANGLLNGDQASGVDILSVQVGYRFK